MSEHYGCCGAQNNPLALSNPATLSWGDLALATAVGVGLGFAGDVLVGEATKMGVKEKQASIGAAALIYVIGVVAGSRV